MWTMLFRSLLIYLFVLIVLRLMGKREIGKLSVFDLVVSIMIADFAVLSIENTDMPFFSGLVPILVMMSAQILFSWLSLKSATIRHLVDGKPTYLIRNGKIQEEEMRRHRYNMDDLLVQLREKNVANVDDVEFAILETSGKLSVFPKTEKEAVKKEDVLGPPPFPRMMSLPIPLVIDREVQEDSLREIGKDRFWLEEQLKKYGYQDLNQVFFVSVDHTGRLYIDPRDDQ
ncbi:MAG: DUF421 domain-containing protein [Firmicutes bacterium]|uniref:Uncharacterized membrane protein YcaP, DUF421 family n=1 Tax=Melghirimyces thermohalophilus TaxID=1236220 RepID=A0A1G6JIR3_9BACL|nr:DUF421 domain-containing protein [Melghirimyces thermohalophilus]MDA8351934.1 DUF421 domain-containing protein [Bacillota bacterium]SDC18624.1 Uncharacterized membrane protein YcaP, DUF421 family [Melghirimyces thermohalophilus]